MSGPHANRVSPFLAWGDFHARSRFARSTIPEEKWGTARSLRILEPMCYCQNHSVLPLVIIPLIALFEVMGLESFYLLFLFPPELPMLSTINHGCRVSQAMPVY